MDEVLVAERPADRRLGEPSHVNVRFHGVDSLTHHEPLVDGGAKSFDLAREISLELARVRPCSQALVVHNGDAAEVANEITQLLCTRPCCARVQSR